MIAYHFLRLASSSCVRASCRFVHHWAVCCGVRASVTSRGLIRQAHLSVPCLVPDWRPGNVGLAPAPMSRVCRRPAIVLMSTRQWPLVIFLDYHATLAILVASPMVIGCLLKPTEICIFSAIVPFLTFTAEVQGLKPIIHHR